MEVINATVPKSFVCRDSLPRPESTGDPVYKCYRDRKDHDRLWLVMQNVINPADHIYVGYPYNVGSQGFAGRILVFNLVDQNRAISLYGPYHSNADALLENTGIDIRNKHYVQLVVGLSREQDSNRRDVITNLVFFQPPGVRAYDEYKSMLPQLYEKHKAPLYYWHGGSGGSMTATYTDRDHVRPAIGNIGLQ